MIELLLQAERALSMGLIDQAERLYRQAADADPRNSIAVVGLARVALERGDDVRAWQEAKRALTIDHENAAAQRMVDRFEEVWRHRGQPLPEPTGAGPGSAGSPLALAPAEASQAWAQITGESAAATSPDNPSDTYGWPESDLRPDTETEPRDSAGRAADDGFPVAEDEIHDTRAAEADGGGRGVPGGGRPAEHEATHPSTLPGLDRVRHLFARKRE